MDLLESTYLRIVSLECEKCIKTDMRYFISNEKDGRGWLRPLPTGNQKKDDHEAHCE